MRTYLWKEPAFVGRFAASPEAKAKALEAAYVAAEDNARKAGRVVLGRCKPTDWIEVPGCGAHPRRDPSVIHPLVAMAVIALEPMEEPS